MTLLTHAYAAPARSEAPRALLVLLPGAGMTATDFASHGFVQAVHRRAWPLDILAVETGVECYLDDELAARLHEDVIAPHLLRGVTRLWLGGISLGGFGALRYAQDHGELIEGLLLLAPFIGSRGLIAEVEQAGGIAQWQPASQHAANPQQALLQWLACRAKEPGSRPALHLGYGLDDRFAAAHHLLAALLPAAQVTRSAGGHDWDTWESLWERLLDSAPLGACATGEVCP